MKKINNLENFSSSSDSENDNNYEQNNKINEIKTKEEKILCNHCGRTAKNGIRCLGICVADNDY